MFTTLEVQTQSLKYFKKVYQQMFITKNEMQLV
jgi:hypothetical protein